MSVFVNEPEREAAVDPGFKGFLSVYCRPVDADSGDRLVLARKPSTERFFTPMDSVESQEPAFHMLN